MEKRKVLCAKEGNVFTNGIIYGKIIYLASNLKCEDFHEIEENEYKKILVKGEEEIM